MKILKSVLWFAGFGVLGYILLISFLLFGPKITSYADRTSFEVTQWKSHLESQDPIKLRMVDDLLSRYRLIGMNTEEIAELIGVPPKTDYFKDYDYVYWLGPERNAFGIDSEWLGLKFQNGKVINADILKD